MKKKEKICLVYIDDDREEAVSHYLAEEYVNELCDIEYLEEDFIPGNGYEGLLKKETVKAANVIIIDTKLFENDSIKYSGKFSGEEFRMVLRRVFPYIEVLVISQNGESEEYDIIPKYRSGSASTADEHYAHVLKDKVDEAIRRVVTFRNISKKLENNKEIDKVLVERTVGSLRGIEEYQHLSKSDIDKLIETFEHI